MQERIQREHILRLNLHCVLLRAAASSCTTCWRSAAAATAVAYVSAKVVVLQLPAYHRTLLHTTSEAGSVVSDLPVCFKAAAASVTELNSSKKLLHLRECSWKHTDAVEKATQVTRPVYNTVGRCGGSRGWLSACWCARGVVHCCLL
jgi:hypothetical protein